MKVADAMTRNLVVAVPEMSVQAAARLMGELDAGVLPVVDGGRVKGMITDRDIALRAVALGLGPETPVAEVMTPEARYCLEDDELGDVVAGMGELQVRRMPVLDSAGELVGILSLADAVLVLDPPQAGEALEAISEPGGDHSQSDDSDPAAPVAPTGASDCSMGVRHFSDRKPR